MAFDGIFMAALVSELQEKLTGGRIDKIYQPENDTLILGLRCEGFNHRLKLTASSSLPYISLSSARPENPAQPPMFCMLLRKHLTGARLVEIRQNGLERIVDFIFDTRDELGNRVERILTAEIMGRHSNLIFYQADSLVVIDAVKRVSSAMSRVRQIYPGIRYQLPPGGKEDLREVSEDAILASTEDLPLKKWLLDRYQGFSPALCQHLSYEAEVDPDLRLGELSASACSRLAAVLRLLRHTLIQKTLETRLLLDDSGIPVDFTAAPLIRMQSYGNVSPVTSPTECVNTLYEHRDQRDRLDQKSAVMKKQVETRLERLVNKHSNLEADLLQAEDADRQKQYGELLLSNVHRLTKGEHLATLENFFEDDAPSIEIPLDVRLTPVENAQRYFRKYTKLRHGHLEIQTQLKQTQEEIQYLESVLLLMDQSTDPSNLEVIRAELVDQGYLKGRGKKKAKLAKQATLRFMSSEGFEILVGRNNVQNDELTLKTASNKDMWFHTKSIPGSHVIIRTQGKSVGESTLREAAMLAAWHSKARNSSQVPVDYTEVRHVSKPSGAKPGMVIYVHNKTLYVTPEETQIDALRSEAQKNQTVKNK
jgi:predicted ribosome quality control (RQC) complex YloA/Tae2 family protein